MPNYELQNVEKYLVKFTETKMHFVRFSIESLKSFDAKFLAWGQWGILFALLGAG